jgi:ornithine cyclodeaminase
MGLVEAYDLTEMRTGAVSAVACKYLARPDSQVLGIIGTGRESRAQLRAVPSIMKFSKIKAFSRTPEPREVYVSEMKDALGIPIVGVETAEECVHDSDVVLTITNATEPVFDGAWLSPGTFVCGVGATGSVRRELDEETVGRAGMVVVESLPTAVSECGELIHASNRGRLRWNTVRELKDIVSGLIPARRSPEEISLFTSVGTGAEDVAVAAHVLGRARERASALSCRFPHRSAGSAKAAVADPAADADRAAIPVTARWRNLSHDESLTR